MAMGGGGVEIDSGLYPGVVGIYPEWFLSMDTQCLCVMKLSVLLELGWRLFWPVNALSGLG